MNYTLENGVVSSGIPGVHWSEYSPAEREEWELRRQAETRAYLFSIGQPLVYKKNGHMIAEYADGRVKVIR